MRKFCVFCGEKPVDKNKEHVIPQWLIKYTGAPNRIAKLGKKNGKELKITWLNFVFPACEECNTKFGKIESKVQQVLIKIDQEKALTHEDLDLFLDWLDKVRIGMWLGHAMLNNKDFEPNFFINSRVGSKDRLCLVYKMDDDEKGIGIIGTDTPVFENTPSCFTIIINNMVFLNYSKEFLLGRNLGFPYPDVYSYDEEFKLKINKFLHGEYKVKFPIIEGEIIKPAIKLYQCINNGPHDLVRPFGGSGRSYYNLNCLAFRHGLIQSKIYLSDEQADFHSFWPQKEKYTFKFKERFDRVLFQEVIIKLTLEHQNHSMHESLKRLEEVPKGEKMIIDEYYGGLLKVNNDKIDEIQELTKRFYKHI